MKFIKKILLIDDDKDDSDLLKEAFSLVKPSAEIHTVHNGHDALKLLESMHPDFIFLDINMPVQDGFEFLQKMRRNTEFENIPVAIYSTSGSENQIRKAYNNAANMYIKKPSSFSEIKEVIEKIISLDLRDFVPGPPDYNNFVIG